MNRNEQSQMSHQYASSDFLWNDVGPLQIISRPWNKFLRVHDLGQAFFYTLDVLFFAVQFCFLSNKIQVVTKNRISNKTIYLERTETICSPSKEFKNCHFTETTQVIENFWTLSHSWSRFLFEIHLCSQGWSLLLSGLSKNSRWSNRFFGSSPCPRILRNNPALSCHHQP